MSRGSLRPWWNASLLEVTLLSYFHAGQSQMWVMWMTPPTPDDVKDMTTKTQEMIDTCTARVERMELDPTKKKTATDKCNRRAIVPYRKSKVIFTDETIKQAKGGTVRKDKNKEVTMVDYWQFSFVVNRQQRGRSGINVTKPAFRALGREITKYENKNHPEVVSAIESHLPDYAKEGRYHRKLNNVYAELSYYLISDKTKDVLSDNKALAEDFEAFLNQVRDDADKITGEIKKNKRYDKKQFYLFNGDHDAVHDAVGNNN